MNSKMWIAKDRNYYHLYVNVDGYEGKPKLVFNGRYFTEPYPLTAKEKSQIWPELFEALTGMKLENGEIRELEEFKIVLKQEEGVKE